jgi:membrane protein
MTDANAATPAQISGHGWLEVLKRTWTESSRDNVNIIAAGVAFYAFLAFVPLLAAMVLTYGLVAEPSSVVRHMQALTNMMPADAARLIGQQLMSMTQTGSGQKGFGLLLALLLSIYGAMRGASSVMTALNLVYNVEERRGFLRTTLLALLLTLGALGALLIAIVAVSSLAYLDRMLPAAPGLQALVHILFWIGAALVISFLLAALYRYAPDRPNPKWRWLTPGSLAATLLWVGATLGFGFYVSNFGNYNATYGSLGAVIVFLTWLYLTAYILLMGGELNAELEKQTDCETAAGEA